MWSTRLLQSSTCRIARKSLLLSRHSSQSTTRPTFQEIDTKWQEKWAQSRPSSGPVATKPKFYTLPMFAYPSGSLHIGHVRVYTISDVIARYKRMKGYDVLHPTGWDAFGLPAENAAIERGIDPATWTEDNIGKMKETLKSMNIHFDWDREFRTCSPSFYKHTQKIFLMLFRRGLAYQSEALVNFDPVDKTVLANEQVDANGRSWRSGALVQQIKLKQWFFRITAFREALLDDLEYLQEGNKWPERVIAQQKNWLGKSQGAKIRFQIDCDLVDEKTVNVFTTRPDTLFGVTYLALSFSHPLVSRLAKDSPALQAFLDKKSSFSPDSKEGFELPSVSARNPVSLISVNGLSSLPVFAAPYVLDDYGEGAVMGVPGHDARDLAFWRKNRPNDTVPLVISNERPPILLQPPVADVSEAFTDRGVLTSICGQYAGLQSIEAGRRIVDDLRISGLAEITETWRLRDWLVSRQRYWGTPIPIVHCKQCGTVPVPEEQLPIELPILDESIRGKTGNPLEQIESWVNTTCPTCRSPAKRETDTMDTFVDSSWYFLRFPDVRNEAEPFSRASTESMLPVDAYVGGVEHAILHLLYARFIYKFLGSEGLIKKEAVHEPFLNLVAQGMVHGKTFSDPKTGRFLLPHEINGAATSFPEMVTTGRPPSITWEKMSKSKHNGVDPSKCIQEFGADAVRAHILFAAPVSEILEWDEQKIVGIQRWFNRVSRLVKEYQDLTLNSYLKSTDYLSAPNTPNLMNTLTFTNAEAFLLTQKTIKAVTHTFERDIYGLNTVISDLTKLTNGLVAIGLRSLFPWVAYESLTALLRMLAPVAPAFAEQSWEDLKQPTNERPARSIFDCVWPAYVLNADLEAQILERMSTMTCAVQVNGKLRFTAKVPMTKTRDQKDDDRNIAESPLMDFILSTEQGSHWLLRKNNWAKRKRIVVVAGGKLINVVF